MLLNKMRKIFLLWTISFQRNLPSTTEKSLVLNKDSLTLPDNPDLIRC